MTFKEFHKHIVGKYCLTQDFPVLHEYEKHNVFVYGTLKRGGSRGGVLNPKECVGVGRTLTPMYTMQTYVPGRFPLVTTGGKAYITGEVYSVKTDVIGDLDRIEANGYLYQRRATRIWIPERSQAVHAWMYVTLPNKFKENHISDTDNIDKLKLNSVEAYSWHI